MPGLQPLRLLTEEVAEQFADPRQALTVRQCYERYLLPEHQREPHAAGTLACYRTFLKHWEACSGNPPVGRISSDVLLRWKEAMRLRVASDQTFGKYARCLRAVLRRIGPYETRNPQAVEVLERVPYLKPPKPVAKAHRIIPPQHWEALYRACSAATFTCDRRVPAPLLWRTVFTLDLCIGPRTSDLFALTRSAISFEERCPVWEWWINAPHGWIDFRAVKTGKRHVIPLPLVVRRHVEALLACTRGGPESLLFPLGGDSSSDDKTRQTVRKLLQSAAGIEQPYTFHDMRDNCNMLWNRAKYPAGDWVLGHAIPDEGTTSVNRMYYQVGVPYMLDALPLLEIPPAMASGPD